MTVESDNGTGIDTPTIALVPFTSAVLDLLDMEAVDCRGGAFVEDVTPVAAGFLLDALLVGDTVAGFWNGTSFPVPLASPERPLSPLAMLRTSLLEAISSTMGTLLNFFQSHSPGPLALSHLALQPAPMPSTAALGSSYSLNSSQFA